MYRLLQQQTAPELTLIILSKLLLKYTRRKREFFFPAGWLVAEFISHSGISVPHHRFFR